MNKVYIVLGAIGVMALPLVPVEAKTSDILTEYGVFPWFSPIELSFIFDDEQDEVSAVIADEPEHEPVTEGTKKVATPPGVLKKQKIPKKEIHSVKASTTDNRKVLVTAYSSTIDQTDSSPCITANGFNVCKHNQENIIAANFLSFGTRVRLPDLYEEKIFTVQDRMHQRYSNRVDIWMKTKQKAKNFGVKYTTIEIVPEQVALGD